MNTEVQANVDLFLFYVNGICGLEDWIDRKLLCRIESMVKEEDKITCVVNLENDYSFLQKLYINKNYAISVESTTKEYFYYKLKAFEFIPAEAKLILTVERIQVGA